MKRKNSLSNKSVGLVILTHQAEKQIASCLEFILLSPIEKRILVIDSESTDQTVFITQSLGVETLIIPQATFNHGTTRELARKHLNTDIICYFTQDAYLTDKESLYTLIKPILEEKASIAYARQVPHEGACFFEAFPRHFNYPKTSTIRHKRDIKKQGMSAFFCSNSCAAYSNAALEDIKGFDSVLLGEDTLATAKLLHRGHSIAYVAEVLVKHSHRYSLKQEFQRHFDAGLVRSRYKDVFSCENDDIKKGKDYAKTLFKTLYKENKKLIPYGLTHLLFKWLGYKIGLNGNLLPVCFKKIMSSQKFYWKEFSR